MLDLNLLPMFVAVAETSSFSTAAIKLAIPKSSISRGIASLEDELGVRLFHRTTRHVALSTAGTALFERSARLLAQLQTAVSDLPELQSAPSGKLRITAPVDFGSTLLAEIVTRFTALYPSVEVDIRLDNSIVELAAAGVDIAFRIATRPMKDSALIAQKAGTVGVQIYAAPSYLARRGTPHTPKELAAHDWVMLRGANELRLVGPDKPVTVEPKGRLVCDDMFFMREALRAGAGVGILPTFLAAADLAAGALVCALPKWSMQQGTLWIVSPGGRNSPRKVVVFRDFVLEAFAAWSARQKDAPDPVRS